MRALCDASGIVLILDDVRAGFRLHLGGSGERFGVRPDLACYSKALANGYPLSACVGRDALQDAAERVFFTGSYFTSAVPMAAALACLRELEASDAIAHMERVGLRLQRGLEAQAAAHGLADRLLRAAGAAVHDLRRRREVRPQPDASPPPAPSAASTSHPYHNWFLSAAHSERDIDRVLEVTDEAFAAVRRAAA